MSADDLDTGFIGRHGGELLDPKPASPEVAAMAAVARHMVKVVVGGGELGYRAGGGGDRGEWAWGGCGCGGGDKGKRGGGLGSAFGV